MKDLVSRVRAALIFTLVGSGACDDEPEPSPGSARIGPDGGAVISEDGVLTISIRPDALVDEIEVSVEESGVPPPVFGPRYRVRPDMRLDVPASITFRFGLPADTSAASIGAVLRTDFEAGRGRWYALPVARLEPEDDLISGTDPNLSMFYGLLGEAAPPLAE